MQEGRSLSAVLEVGIGPSLVHELDGLIQENKKLKEKTENAALGKQLEEMKQRFAAYESAFQYIIVGQLAHTVDILMSQELTNPPKRVVPFATLHGQNKVPTTFVQLQQSTAWTLDDLKDASDHLKQQRNPYSHSTSLPGNTSISEEEFSRIVSQYVSQQIEPNREWLSDSIELMKNYIKKRQGKFMLLNV